MRRELAPAYLQIAAMVGPCARRANLAILIWSRSFDGGMAIWPVSEPARQPRKSRTDVETPETH